MEPKSKFFNISSLTESMPKSYKKIFSFIQTNQDAVSAMSITQLARKLNVDVATITRFCQSIGFSGYAILKYSLKHDDAFFESEKTQEPFDPADSVKDTMDKVKYFYKKAIKDQVELINPCEKELAAQKICTASKVHL